MRSVAFVLLQLLLTQYTSAHVALRSGEWCFGGCDTVINYANFNDTGPGSKKARSCESTLRTTSLYLCIDEYCTDTGRTAWLQNANRTCSQKNNITLPPYNIIDRYTPEERAGIKRLSAEEAFTWPTLNEIVIPDDDIFERAFTTMVRHQHLPMIASNITPGCSVLRILHTPNLWVWHRTPATIYNQLTL